MLNKNQVLEIENYLIKQDVDYIDLKYELLDHIVSDIEHIIETEDISFNEAFARVKLKWKSSLKAISGRWLGGWLRKKPKVFVDNHRKIIKPIFSNILLYTILLSVVLYTSLELFELKLDSVLKHYQNILFVLLGVTLLLEIWRFWRMFLIKGKTIFSYIYKAHFIFTPLYVFMFLIGTFGHEGYIPTSKAGQYIPVFCLIMLILYGFSGFIVYNKHLREIKNLREILS